MFPANDLCPRKADALDSTSYLAPNFMASWISLPSVLFPFSFYNPVPSKFNGSPDPVGSGLREILTYSNKVRRTELLTLLEIG